MSKKEETMKQDMKAEKKVIVACGACAYDTGNILKHTFGEGCKSAPTNTDGEEADHNCDSMGCSSVGEHKLEYKSETKWEEELDLLPLEVGHKYHLRVWIKQLLKSREALTRKQTIKEVRELVGNCTGPRCEHEIVEDHGIIVLDDLTTLLDGLEAK